VLPLTLLLSGASAIIFVMSEINIENLIDAVVSFAHPEHPETQSEHLIAFINGWNNALNQVIVYLKDQKEMEA
jgi:hypothetical protein